jgi:hypothetical protein
VHRSSNKDSAPSWIIENGDEVEITGACAYTTNTTAVALAHLRVLCVTSHPSHLVTLLSLVISCMTVYLGTCMLHVIIGYNRGNLHAAQQLLTYHFPLLSSAARARNSSRVYDRLGCIDRNDIDQSIPWVFQHSSRSPLRGCEDPGHGGPSGMLPLQPADWLRGRAADPQ